MSRATYTHKFVKAFPERLDEGVLYVSLEFATAAHRCFCGCGSEVYTRFSPTDWSMKFNGETISIHPSVGNWSFACQSHYILANGQVRWAAKMSREDIELGRAIDRKRKEQLFGGSHSTAQAPSPGGEQPSRPNWVSADENLIDADVLRWTESVFANPRRGKGKALRIGERQVVAEVLRTDRNGWVFLLVRSCTLTAENFARRNVPPLKYEAAN